MDFNLDHDVFPLHLENPRDILYKPLKTSQRIKYSCFALSKKYLIFGATSGGLYVFKRHPYKFYQLIPSKESAIVAVAISSSETLVACVTNKNIVRIVEVDENCNGKLITRTEELSDSEITALCWNEDVAKPTLFIGDKGGRVSYLKLSFLSKNILNVPTTLFMSLDSKIVQLCCENDLLVASTLTRCYLCDVTREHFKPIGQQLRDGLYGVTFLKNKRRIFCARPGGRLWEVDLLGDVHSTHQFKQQLVIPPSTFISLFNEPKIIAGNNDSSVSFSQSINFIKLFDFLGRYIVAHNRNSIYVLNTDTVGVLFGSNHFGNIIDVQCVLNSVFIWNSDGDLHELTFLPIEKYVLTLFLRRQYDLCVHMLCIFYEKLISSASLHELYPLKELEYPLKEDDNEETIKKLQILTKFKKNLLSSAAKEMKLRSGIHVVNNRYLSSILLDDITLNTLRTDISGPVNGSDITDNGEYRKRSNSLPSTLKKISAEENSQLNAVNDKLLDGQSNMYDGSFANGDLYNSPFVAFASYDILRENFSEIGANFSQILNDGSRNLKQKWLTLESKITSRMENTNSNVSVPVRDATYLQDDVITEETDDEPIVEKRKGNLTNELTNTSDELALLYVCLQSESVSDVDLFDALNTVMSIWDRRISGIMSIASATVKEVFSSRCFTKSFLTEWFASENFNISLPSDLMDQYPSMLACLFDEEELKFDFFLSHVLNVFCPLLEARSILDKIKSFQLPCYYKSFCYVLKHFQKDDPRNYERAEGERIDWPTPVYLNTMLLMISVDRKDVFCEMGIKKNVDAIDIIYILLHVSQKDSKDEIHIPLYDYKSVWLSYLHKQYCENEIDCLNDVNVLRLAVNTLVSYNSDLSGLCCSNCWFLLPQINNEIIEYESLSCAILARFWLILLQSKDSSDMDHTVILSLRRAISGSCEYQPLNNACYKNLEDCNHLICDMFKKFIDQTSSNLSSILAFNAVCNLCYRVPFLWKQISSLQTNSSLKLLDLFHFIQLKDMKQLKALFPVNMDENQAETIFDCTASMSEGRCLNCNTKVHNGYDRVSWNDVSIFVLQRLGASRTLKLLQRYSAAKVGLSSCFYRSALLTSLPRIGVDFRDRILSTVSDHCEISHISSNNFANLRIACEKDNVLKKTYRMNTSTSDAHHWGISVQTEHTNQAICYCCSLPLFSKSLIKEYNGGITVFSCSHTYHTVCLKNKNCALTCIVCDRFLR